MNRASRLVTASFAAFMAGTSLSAATVVDDTTLDIKSTVNTNFSKSLQQPLQLADIGNWFNELTSDYPNNKSILDLDQKFQEILGDINEIHNFSGPFDDNIHDPYSADMQELAYGYYTNNLLPEGSINLQIDLCTSEEMSGFYKKYLAKIKKYLRDNPDIDTKIGDTQRRLQELENGIEELDQINKDFRQELLKENQIPACGQIAKVTPTKKLI